eukprot:UN10005
MKISQKNLSRVSKLWVTFATTNAEPSFLDPLRFRLSKKSL